MKNKLSLLFVMALLSSRVFGMSQEEYAEGVRSLMIDDMPFSPGSIELRESLLDGVSEHYDFIVEMKQEFIDDDEVTGALAYLVGASSLPAEKKRAFLKDFLRRDNPEDFKGSTYNALKYWDGEIESEVLLKLLDSNKLFMQQIAANKAAVASRDPRVLNRIVEIEQKLKSEGAPGKAKAAGFAKASASLRARIEKSAEGKEKPQGETAKPVEDPKK